MASKTPARRRRARPGFGPRAGRAWLAAIAAAVVVTAAVLALVAAGRLDAGAQPPAWRQGASLAIMAVGAVGVIAGLLRIWAPRAGSATPEDFAQERSLSVKERRQATNTIRQGQPAAPGAQEMTTVSARVTARQRATSPLLLGIIVIFLGILLQPSSPGTPLLVSAAVVLAGTALQLPAIRRAHRAQHWLDEHGQQVADHRAGS